MLHSQRQIGWHMVEEELMLPDVVPNAHSKPLQQTEHIFLWVAMRMLSALQM